MSENIFYSFKEKVRLTRIFVSILLIGIGYTIYSLRDSIFYWQMIHRPFEQNRIVFSNGLSFHAVLRLGVAPAL